MQDTFETTGRFGTANAQKYMQQLCKHFAHKVPAEVTGDQAQVQFARGNAQMQALPDQLEVTISTNDQEAIGFLREVIDDHLRRFAFREEFSVMDWSEPVAR